MSMYFCSLGRLREFNGNACPFDVTEDPRDEKINYLEEQLKEVNWILDETREQYVRMNTRYIIIDNGWLRRC